MSYSGGQDGVPPRPAGEFAAPPRIPRAALDGVRTRRIIAVCLDFILVSTLSVVIFFGLLFLSFGMTAILLPPIFPLVAFFYNGLTVSGWRMATPGMRFMDLEMRTMTGEPHAVHKRRRSRGAVLCHHLAAAPAVVIFHHQRQTLPT